MKADLLHHITNNWHIKILSVIIAVGIYLFYRVKTELIVTYTRPVAINSAEGFIVTDSEYKFIDITLRGRSDDINRVNEDEIEFFIDLSGIRDEGTWSVPVQLDRNIGIANFAGQVTWEPESMEVAQERYVDKQLPIVTNIVGNPDAGYEIVRITIDPPIVTATGPISVIEDIENIHTRQIDVGEKSRSYQVNIQLNNESRFVSLSTDTVQCHIELRAVTGERIINNIVPIVQNLAPQFDTEGEIEGIDITLSGTWQILDNLNINALSVSVDAIQIEESGGYRLPVKVSLPPGLRTVNIYPQEILLNVADGEPEETEDPSAGTDAAGTESAGTESAAAANAGAAENILAEENAQ